MVDKGNYREAVGGEILLPKGGVANGTVRIYHFNIDFRNRLHNGN